MERESNDNSISAAAEEEMMEGGLSSDSGEIPVGNLLTDQPQQQPPVPASAQSSDTSEGSSSQGRKRRRPDSRYQNPPFDPSGITIQPSNRVRTERSEDAGVYPSGGPFRRQSQSLPFASSDEQDVPPGYGTVRRPIHDAFQYAPFARRTGGPRDPTPPSRADDPFSTTTDPSSTRPPWMGGRNDDIGVGPSTMPFRRQSQSIGGSSPPSSSVDKVFPPSYAAVRRPIHDPFQYAPFPRRGSRSDKTTTPEAVVAPPENQEESDSQKWNTKRTRPQPRPPLFSRSLSKAERPIDEFETVLDRLMHFFQKESIQGVFTDIPPTAKLQTIDMVEFIIKFWEAPDDQFCVDIQRRSGDQYSYRKLMHLILDIVHETEKAVGGDSTPAELHRKDNPVVEPSTVTPSIPESKQNEQDRPSVVLPSDSKPPAKVEPEELTNPLPNPSHYIIDSVHARLSSGAFSQRGSGLSSLIQATQMRSTQVPHAREMAYVALGGRAPTSLEQGDALIQKCLDIQGTLLGVLFKREFEGDDAWKRALDNVADNTSRPFLSSSSEAPLSKYDSGMIQWVHKVLQVFSNSLEVLTFDGVHAPMNQVILSSFFERCRQIDTGTNSDLVSTLAVWMEEYRRYGLAIAYGACRILRQLSSLYPPFQEELQQLHHDRIEACIEGLADAGRFHSLMEIERQLLSQGIRISSA